MPDLRGDGEYIMRISRFIPDFITQTGNTRVKFKQDYPNSTEVLKFYMYISQLKKIQE